MTCGVISNTHTELNTVCHLEGSVLSVLRGLTRSLAITAGDGAVLLTPFFHVQEVKARQLRASGGGDLDLASWLPATEPTASPRPLRH